MVVVRAAGSPAKGSRVPSSRELGLQFVGCATAECDDPALAAGPRIRHAETGETASSLSRLTSFSVHRTNSTSQRKTHRTAESYPVNWLRCRRPTLRSLRIDRTAESHCNRPVYANAPTHAM